MSEDLRNHYLPPQSTSYYQLRTYPDPILKQHAILLMQPYAFDDDLLPRMKEILAQHRGLGIAAQQVGSLWNVALMMLTPANPSPLAESLREHLPRELVVAINPEIITRSTEIQVHAGEGCLSAMWNGEYFRTSTRRSARCTLRYQDLEQFKSGSGRHHLRSLEGLDAVIAQHEVDHLQGKCIVDGISRQQRRQLERDFKVNSGFSKS